MTISKERVIVLTSYERRSLVRFLTLYLGSVFVLLAIIGYLFFENNKAAMKSATKFEMMYQSRMIFSEIVLKAMLNVNGGIKVTERKSFLKGLKHCRFKVGYYDEDGNPIYTEIKEPVNFEKDFYIENDQCYTVTRNKSVHMGIKYIVLKESGLSAQIQALRIKIIGYLVLSFILMGVVGYFLGRLFLQPVREQIESLNRFIADTTHELNTPVSAILMTVQSLKGIDEKKRKRLEASAKRLSVMYSSLTYRLEGKVEPDEWLRLDQIIEARVEYVRDLAASKRLRMELDLEPTLIHMNQQSAYRLIDNLLSNAIKYSDVGDSVTITLKDNTLKVKDTGIGIDKKKQSDIFKRFHRANEERGGFGIGLDIVLSICEKYKIKLELDSKKGEGSTFILTFRDK
ncbi:sensor histidine kinase [Sulfurovum sp. NBC37-1]|uniref:sensor histidine kinase n=1 Tax=Sulfurovum sp. (strain NBC37-1) TaxID=387093 RepID=UPI0001587BBB|nr:HAMP domain-containing sensor histidine kinase [Sulfurovum sp. NBC37-1]BAF72815.1 two-component sensor histidine kinase [Sulfurovum sp. NBC37-1]